MGEFSLSKTHMRLLGVLLAAVVGWCLGAGAWGIGRSAALAAILPLAIGLAGSRLQAFTIGLFYTLGAGRVVPVFAATWFDDNLVAGASLWMAFGIIGGLAWSLGWTASNKPWRKALACSIAWTVALLPPVATFVPGHPVIAWGYITPNTGWFGVFLSVAVPCGLLWLVAAKAWPRRHVIAGSLALALLSGGGSFAYTEDQSRYVSDIVAVDTKWGKANDPFEILNRIEKMGRMTKGLAEENLASVVIFPESVIQTYDPSLFPVLELELLKEASKVGQTIILGADIPTATGNYQTSAIAFYPDGRTATATARQTVPVALWKPWAETGSYQSNWGANNILTLRDGVRARIIFCYEEYIPVLSLINEARNDHQMVVVMSNTWAAKDELAPVIQSRHSEGVARLFGRKLLKSENRPVDIASIKK